jgi:glycosyltransferase involved in cell wall biosynthesis
MRVMHVGWGFQPWRGGGLISYAEDVMEAQAERGHEVAYFFAGRRYPLLPRPRLHRWRRRGVSMLEVLNSPIPVGLDRGTRFPELDLDEPATEALFRRALHRVRPDVVHLQELTGLPSALIEVAERAGVPLVMTLQDYFGLCPTLKLYDSHGQICMRTRPGPECTVCCRDAPASAMVGRGMTTSFEIDRLTARLPAPIREPVQRRLRSTARSAGSGAHRRAAGASAPAPDHRSADAYQRRRDVNLARLGRVDVLAGMSSRVTEIHALLGVDAGALRTVHLTLAHLERLTPRVVEEPPRPVRFVTLTGAQNEQKGARVLLAAVAALAASGLGGSYALDVYGPVDPELGADLERVPEVRLAGSYGEPDELDAVLESADVGIVPSVWEEAFGFVGLELLAKGIPVIGSARGGIPDYTVPGETGWLNRSCTGEELAEIMRGVIGDPGQVVELNRSIRDRRHELVKPLGRHLDELEAIYAEVAR